MPSFSSFGCFLANRDGAGGGASLFCRWDSWWIVCRAAEVQSRFNKYVRRITRFASEWSSSSLTCRGGEKRRRRYSAVERFVLQEGDHHVVDKIAAAFSGQDGGRISTSMAEALAIWRQSSASRSGQVIRSRLRRDCWRPIVRRQGETECSTGLRSRRSRAWRSPVTGGGVDIGLDCFSILSSKVCFVKMQGLSSNFRSSWAIDVKGLCKFCTRPPVL